MHHVYYTKIMYTDFYDHITNMHTLRNIILSLSLFIKLIYTSENNNYFLPLITY